MPRFTPMAAWATFACCAAWMTASIDSPRRPWRSGNLNRQPRMARRSTLKRRSRFRFIRPADFSKGRSADRGEYELGAFLDRIQSKFDQVVAQGGVSFSHRIVSRLRFLESLLSLRVEREDFPPRRRDEHPAVITKYPRGAIHMGGNG